MRYAQIPWVWRSIIALALLSVMPTHAFGHCDGMDGPVVKAAQAALEQKDVNLVLIWVREEYEPEVRRAFARTVTVRELGSDARELADMYFFETVVRLHRLGEGAPYTGLKPAGRDLGPAIPAADRALESGSIDDLVKLMTETLRSGLREQYERALRSKGFATDDLAAGREYIEHYVAFIHYVERAYEAGSTSVDGHFPEPSLNDHGSR
jgi:hypothetical protein